MLRSGIYKAALIISVAAIPLLAAAQSGAALGALTGLSYKCNSAGTQVTLSWNAASNATSYQPNVNSTSTCPAGWYANGGTCSQGYGTAGPLVTGTSTVFATNPGQAYSWYLYGINGTSVDWAKPTGGQVFTCNRIVPPPPTGLAYQCNADGTQVTLSWDSTPNATDYSPNVNTTGSCPAGWYARSGGGGCNQGYGTAGRLITATSTTFATTPGQAYSWYLYAVNDTVVDFSKPAAGQVFSCKPIDPQYASIRGTVFFDPLFDTVVEDDLASDILSSEIQRIKAAGFNTVWLHQGWGEFETSISPATYNQAAFARLKTLLSILQANNMKATIIMDPFIVPQGLNSPFSTTTVPWIEVPSQWQAFIQYSNYFLNQILPYKDSVYVYDTDADIYGSFWNDPAKAAVIEQGTLGDWPAQLDPTLRSQFKLGFEDLRLLNEGYAKSLQTSPIANPNPFDWLSFSYYPLANGMPKPADTSSYAADLDARFSAFQQLYPLTPAMIVEMGYPSCRGADGEAQQSSSLQAMINYAVSRKRGFQIWSWEPAEATINFATSSCAASEEFSLSLVRPDGTLKSAYQTVQSLLNPSGSTTASVTVPSWQKTNQPFNALWVAPPAHNAASQIPPSMQPGKSYPVSVTMQNTGTTAWAPGLVQLEFMGTRDVSYVPNYPNDLWGVQDVQVPAGTTVAPGQNFTFNFTVKAPAAAQNYYFAWRLKSASGWFGQPTTPSYVVLVDPSAPAPVPLAPMGLSYQCSVDGTYATLSWYVTPGATSYVPNVNTSGSCPVGWYSNGGTGCSQGIISAGQPAVTKTSTRFPTIPGRTYSWYLYAMNGSGVNWANPAAGQVFTCGTSLSAKASGGAAANAAAADFAISPDNAVLILSLQSKLVQLLQQLLRQF